MLEIIAVLVVAQVLWTSVTIFLCILDARRRERIRDDDPRKYAPETYRDLLGEAILELQEKAGRRQ